MTGLFSRLALLPFFTGIAAAASIAVLLLAGCATDPYITALQEGDFEGVRAEVEADPESANRTAEERLYPLNLAASHSRARIIRYLVKHGADPNHRDSHGKTPLFRVGSQFKHNERGWFRDFYQDHIWAEIRGGEDMSTEESAAVTEKAVSAVQQKAQEAGSGETKIGSYTRSDLTYYEKALVDYNYSSRFVSNFIAFSTARLRRGQLPGLDIDLGGLHTKDVDGAAERRCAYADEDGGECFRGARYGNTSWAQPLRRDVRTCLPTAWRGPFCSGPRERSCAAVWIRA